MLGRSFTLALPALAACIGSCMLNREGQGPLAAETGGAAGAPSAGGEGGEPFNQGGAFGGAMPEGGGGAGPGSQSCLPGQFVTAIDEAGTITCGPVDAATIDAFNESCSVYLGWQDQCSGCTNDPTKWGNAGATTCANGTGTDNTCSQATLGGEDVRLFGLNTDGDVNFDDKFHIGLHCVAPPADTTTPGPCAAGSYVSAITPSGVECTTVVGAATLYARDSCSVYLAWRDACNGCTDPVSKWGRAADAACEVGTGIDCTCDTSSLSGVDVELFGLNTDGGVNGDDTFYVGIQCSGAMANGTAVTQSCPPGELVAGVIDDGTILCASPLPAFEAAIRNGCYVYFGWSGTCGGCTDPPVKWGRTSAELCENGTGTDNTCTVQDLDGTMSSLFGLNLDADVNDDDKFFIGLRCP